VQPVGRGHTALRYLAAYVQKTALSASRLVACDERTVTFTHQDRATGQMRALRLSGQEFLRRFLQHVLPSGFQRVRHYGWLSAAATQRRQRIHALLDWRPAPLPQPSTSPLSALPKADATGRPPGAPAALDTMTPPPRDPRTSAAQRIFCDANGAVTRRVQAVRRGGPDGRSTRPRPIRMVSRTKRWRAGRIEEARWAATPGSGSKRKLQGRDHGR
jgi:hypothetical protein